MAGKTQAEAVENFKRPLSRAFSCFVRSVLNVAGGYYAGQEHVATLGAGVPQPLSGGPRLGLLASMRYQIVKDPSPGLGPWRCHLSYYVLALYTETSELIAYHWHPDTVSRVTWPHLHLGTGLAVGFGAATTAHLPTGRVSVEQVLRLAHELGAQPLRRDWEDVLDETEAGFDRARSW